MSTRLLIAAVASSLVGVLGPGLAGAAPTPKYTVTCVVADTTVARWQHASLGSLTIAWSLPGSAAPYLSIPVQVPPRPPHGIVTVGTRPEPVSGEAPATATVTFTPAGGGTPDTVTVDCG